MGDVSWAHQSAISGLVPLSLGGGLVLLVILLGFLKCAQERCPQLTGRFEAPVFVTGFMMCSSVMLIVNKVAVVEFPFLSSLLAAQLISAALAIRIAGLAGFCEVEGLSWARVKSFVVVPFAFLATLWANMQVLKYANVETFIMVRSATPLATAVLDWVFLSRELPSLRALGSLLLSLAGAVGFMLADSTFVIKAYSWGACWLLIFLFDQIYIKHVVTVVEMTTWTRSYYTNAIASGPVLVYALVVEGAPMNFITGFTGSPVIGSGMLIISCALGTAMSLFAFKVRAILSATSLTVAGNACKILSVAINVLLWDKHASQLGISFLGLCLMGSVTYTQSPLRAETVTASAEESEPALTAPTLVDPEPQIVGVEQDLEDTDQAEKQDTPESEPCQV